MSKIYISQSKLELVLSTTVNLAQVSTATIKYRKPSGTTGDLTGSTMSIPAGTITWESPVSSVFDQDGDWSIWVSFLYIDGRRSFSEPFNLKISKEGL